jgi:hypothetical protein
MKKLLSVFLIFGSLIARADLLERMNLEDGFRTRIKEVVKVFDPQAQIITKFSYNTYQGTLPGTTMEYDGKVIPSNIEGKDLAKVDIQVYSAKNKFPEELKNMIKGSLPIESYKVQIGFFEMKSIPMLEGGVTEDFLEKTVQKVVRDMGQFVGFTMALGLLSIGLLVLLLNWRRQKQFSQEIGKIVTSLADLQYSSPATSLPQVNAKAEPMPLIGSNHQSSLAGIQLESFAAMIADCYWTKKDNYAAWLWKNLDFSQRERLLEVLPYMQSYSAYLSEQEGKVFPFTDHAYYLRPAQLMLTSQEDLARVLHEQPSSWHKLSPLRQGDIDLSLEEKLRCMSQTHESVEEPVHYPVSVLRSLVTKGNWGELSAQDEENLFRNPDLVPKIFRSQIKSLVWLGLLPENEIRAKLEKWDARTLATAWIGPQELLNRLEMSLPEKKRELLKNYHGKVSANRQSSAFNLLWEESLKEASSSQDRVG